MRALVSAASRHGSTTGIAQAIAEGLRARGLDVDVLDPPDVQTVDGYDVVVIGSAVYTGHWLPAAKNLVSRHASALRWRDVWLFSSGPLGDPPRFTEEPVDVVPMLGQSGARGHVLLSGRLDTDDLGIGERLLVRVVHAPTGDFRDWPGIAEWTASIVDTAVGNEVGEEAAPEVRTFGGADGPLVPVPGSGS